MTNIEPIRPNFDIIIPNQELERGEVTNFFPHPASPLVLNVPSIQNRLTSGWFGRGEGRGGDLTSRRVRYGKKFRTAVRFLACQRSRRGVGIKIIGNSLTFNYIPLISICIDPLSRHLDVTWRGFVEENGATGFPT